MLNLGGGMADMKYGTSMEVRQIPHKAEIAEAARVLAPENWTSIGLSIET